MQLLSDDTPLFLALPLLTIAASDRGRLWQIRGGKKGKKSIWSFVSGGPRRGWRVSQGIRHDSMMIVAGKLMQQAYLLLLRCLRIIQDRERISLNLTARMEESAVSARQARRWAPINCLLKGRPWRGAIHCLSHSKYPSSFYYYYLKHVHLKRRPPEWHEKQHFAQQ